MRQRISSGYGYEAVHGYSRAVRAGAQVFVSGTTARGEALAQGALEQARSALGVIVAALAEAGARPEHVVRTVLYVTDMADAALVSQAHAEVFGAVRPASTMVQVAALLDPRMRVEIEATAVIEA